jgi:hypothetical protein
MDENAWLTAVLPSTMMGILQAKGTTSERRNRLFACACLRQIWDLLPDTACRQLVEVAEDFAESAVDTDRLGDALAAMQFPRRPRGYVARARTAAWYAGFNSIAASRINPAYAGQRTYEVGDAARATISAVDAAVWKAARHAQQAGQRSGGVMRFAKNVAKREQAG